MNDRVSAKEVSIVLGVTTEAILRHVRQLYPEEIRNGLPTMLSQEQVTAIKARMIPTTQVAGVKTDIEMMQNAFDCMKWMSEKLKQSAEKVECYDRFLSAEDAKPIGEVAKALGFRPRQFFTMLKEYKILLPDNVPYSRYAHLFRVFYFPVGAESKPVTRVLPEGVAYLAKRFKTGLLIGENNDYE